MRVGIVANSDGHKGRPGASYPGSSLFGSYGGLTCFLSPELTRDAIFGALRKRHHYATTGARIYLDTCVNAGSIGGKRNSAVMGDVVRTMAGEAELYLETLTESPIQRIDVFNGAELQHTWRPPAVPSESGTSRAGTRICVLWEGAEYRGRGRETVWDGRAALMGNTYTEVVPINFWNPERRLVREDGRTLSWQSITTGGFCGFIARLKSYTAGKLDIHTPLVRERIPIASLGAEDTVFEAGGLGRRLRAFRLPDVNTARRADLKWTLKLEAGRDNPLYVRVTQEDGHMAWSSPVYLERE
jgi:hypothetical protein